LASFQYIQYSWKRWFIFPILATFFQAEPPLLIAPGQGYPAPHAPTFTPKAATYERWYVANTGNAHPVTNDVVDMHPFHIHLVNFTVTRRWELDNSGLFAPKSPNPADFDGISRHDTVRIQSNELVELLVFFPRGYAVIMCITVISWSMKIWGCCCIEETSYWNHPVPGGFHGFRQEIRIDCTFTRGSYFLIVSELIFQTPGLRIIGGSKKSVFPPVPFEYG